MRVSKLLAILVPLVLIFTLAGCEKAPEVVKNYNAPSDIGTDLYSFQLSYGGDLYKLPAPIAEFEKNGWTLDSDGKEVVDANDKRVLVRLQKDDQVMMTETINFSNKATSLKHTFVTYLEYDRNALQIPIELPLGITEKSSPEEIISAYGVPDEIHGPSELKSYVFGEQYEGVTFWIDEQDEIMRVEIRAKSSALD